MGQTTSTIVVNYYPVQYSDWDWYNHQGLCSLSRGWAGHINIAFSCREGGREGGAWEGETGRGRLGGGDWEGGLGGGDWEGETGRGRLGGGPGRGRLGGGDWEGGPGRGSLGGGAWEGGPGRGGLGGGPGSIWRWLVLMGATV